MQDDQQYPKRRSPCLDSRVLRHMMHETIDLLDMSTDHADEACMHTDAAMALTRVDWMLMAIFNWLTEQLKNEMSGAGYKPLGEPVSIVGIDQNALSDNLRSYAQRVDRLHDRIGKLDTLIVGTVEAQNNPTENRGSGQVLNIFGNPKPSDELHNPVLISRQRLKSAFGA